MMLPGKKEEHHENSKLRTERDWTLFFNVQAGFLSLLIFLGPMTPCHAIGSQQVWNFSLTVLSTLKLGNYSLHFTEYLLCFYVGHLKNNLSPDFMK